MQEADKKKRQINKPLGQPWKYSCSGRNRGGGDRVTERREKTAPMKFF
jgi:hypothetical protein